MPSATTAPQPVLPADVKNAFAGEHGVTDYLAIRN